MRALLKCHAGTIAPASPRLPAFAVKCKRFGTRMNFY